MRTNVALIFFLKRSKNYLSGPVPIYLRITVDGKRSEISCGRDCDPKRWNSNTGRAIGTRDDSRSINSYLDTLQLKKVTLTQEAHFMILRATIGQ